MSNHTKKLLLFVGLVILAALTLRLLPRGLPSVVTGTAGVKIEEGGAKEGDPQAEYIVVHLSPESGKPYSVTGWALSGGRAKALLPGASPLPLQGKVNEEAPIVITRESTIIVSSDHSPIGVSFRENKCVGILGAYQEFYPPLPPPLPERTYSECVEARKSDPDFFRNVWRIYLNSDNELWRNSLEVIKLYDQRNKLLGIFRY